MQRSFTFATNEFYHLYNRGTEKRAIFRSAHDYERFTHLLYLCNGQLSVVYKILEKEKIFSTEKGDALIDIGAYCLMPNHFHILARERTEDGMSTFMKKLLTAYSMYFNKRYERTGNLFEGTFKAKHAKTDQYLKYLFSYIHLNPAKILEPQWKQKMAADRDALYPYVCTYTHSSLQDYLGNRPRKAGVILNKAAFPDYFRKKRRMERELIEWLNFPNLNLAFQG